MNSKMDRARFSDAADEDAIRAIRRKLIDAWNAGDGTGFAAAFTDDVDFVVWEGSHLNGRQELAAFTQEIFDTVVKGSRLGARCSSCASSVPFSQSCTQSSGRG